MSELLERLAQADFSELDEDSWLHRSPLYIEARKLDTEAWRVLVPNPGQDAWCGCTGACLPDNPAYSGACGCVPTYTTNLRELLKALEALNLGASIVTDPPSASVWPRATYAASPEARLAMREAGEIVEHATIELALLTAMIKVLTRDPG